MSHLELTPALPLQYPWAGPLLFALIALSYVSIPAVLHLASRPGAPWWSGLFNGLAVGAVSGSVSLRLPFFLILLVALPAATLIFPRRADLLSWFYRGLAPWPPMSRALAAFGIFVGFVSVPLIRLLNVVYFG
ncbi:hypothetical protein [Pseudoroseomonas cervicalis]|uniref:hypothetical protein n=1 Tax=Teichococcus cervicalis TaxID=204525 RepID=UPI00278662A5|nr:hypothetical protein [Pseudoroseomonas cervicalis]MDQ1080303.1 hypothetical protein [Pseudoroseomonas cervicalis]